MARVDVALEAGAKRTFAVAIDWPGWSRSGRTEADALAALAAYAPRYARSVGDVAVPLEPTLRVVERLEGGATTDFGAPGAVAAADGRPLDAAELARQRRLLEAAWRAFDAAAESAVGAELRKGPRGGGRELGKIRSHVDGADEGYLTKLGSKPPNGDPADAAGATARLRQAALAALQARGRGQEPPNANRTSSRWSPRYYVRRAAWHALDHAWEIEDRLP